VYANEDDILEKRVVENYATIFDKYVLKLKKDLL